MDAERRTLLGAKALLLGACSTTVRAQADVARTMPPGSPGEFNFLAGEWRIHNRMISNGAWIEFEGEATCWTILNGIGSVEELRIPARNFSGMGLRLLDVQNRVWSDFWVNAQSGVLTMPGTTGGFVDGVGTFISEDAGSDPPMLYRGLWDGITSNSHRWSQASSRDGGRTWDDNWLMQWRRA